MDTGLPLQHRFSHARSCAVHLSWKFRVSRETILDTVRRHCGIALDRVTSEGDLLQAMTLILHIKANGLESSLNEPQDS
ncbi:MAG: hypothetical protein QM811_07135 [Pirellulales bacterium]